MDGARTGFGASTVEIPQVPRAAFSTARRQGGAGCELDGRPDRDYIRATNYSESNGGSMGATEAGAAPRRGRIVAGLADRWLDRNFFLLMVALIWLGILMGFVPEIVGRFQTHRLPFPAVVYFHGVVFAGWLCLLTAQVLLIRSRRVDLHRELGIAGAALYGAMIVLGVTTSVVVDDRFFGRAPGDPSFLSVQLADMVNFAMLGGVAIALRKRPDAHKRLLILATICVANVGFARWWGSGLLRLLGDGYWGNWAHLYLSDFLLIVILGAYDLFSRRRLYSAYILGAAWALGLEFVAIWLYVSPWWKPMATVLIGR